MGLFNELKRRNVFKVAVAYTVAAWVLMQVVDLVLESIHAPAWVMQVFLLIVVLGFLVAVIIAWAYEMTPEGLKRDSEVQREESIAGHTAKKLDKLTVVLLVVVGLMVIADRLIPESSDSTEPLTSEVEVGPEQVPATEIEAESVVTDKSVAVLPFVSMSSGEEDGYFADGLTEEILNSLTSLPELLVTARTSSFYFKGKNLPIPEIAAKLGVAHVVEGSVRKSGNRVRITAQLIRANDGFHLWSNTYDRTLDDVFVIQEDIAESIAQTLEVILNADKRAKMKQAGIGNVEAFIAYQKGWAMLERAHSISNPLDLLPEANRYFDQALAIVPAITNAQIARTDLFGHMIYDNATGVSSYTQSELEAALAAIISGISQAIRYAPSDAQRAYHEAERALFSNNWSGIPSNLDRAFQTEECSGVNWVVSLASVFGWARQVSEYYARLMRCDPLSSIYTAMGSQTLIWAGQAQQATELTSRFLHTVAPNAWVDDTRFLSLLASGKYRDDPGVYGPNPENSFFQFPRRIFAYALDNDIAKAREVFDAYQKESVVDDMGLLTVAAVLGKREAANAYASILDARFAGPFILTEVVKSCFCGAPFDLAATPNFKKRLEEAGFDWPPPSPIKFPAKDW